MNTAWFLLPLLACCSTPDDNDGVLGPIPHIDGERAKSYVQKQVNFGPRPAGSEALAKTRDWIVAELKKLGLKPQIDSFSDEKHAKGISFSNILCEIPGSDPEEKRLLVLGSHYDTKLCREQANAPRSFDFFGANDGGSSSGLLLELAHWFKDHPLRCPLLLIWFDGEESIDWDWNDNRSLFGSKRAVQELRKRFPKDKPLYEHIPVMFLLDMIGAKTLHVSRDTNSSRALQDIVFQQARHLGKQSYFFKTETAVTDDHMPFLDYSIEVINLIDFGPPTPDWWHTEKDNMEIISAKSLELIGQTTAMALPVIVERFYPKPEKRAAQDKKK